MKKVLYVLDKSGYGGIQSLVNPLIHHDFSKVEVNYFFLRNINYIYGISDIKKPEVVYSSAIRKYSLICFLELYRLITKRKYEIIHLNGTKSVIFGVLIKWLLPHVKIVSHDHSGEFDYKRWFVLFHKFIKKIVDRYICVSERRKRFLVEKCGVMPEKVMVLNNFVDEERFSSAMRNDFGIKTDNDSVENQLVIGFVGRLSMIKGCDILIRSIPIIRKKINKLSVLIAGDGPERSRLESLAKELDVSDCTRFLGYVKNPAFVYSSSDILVIPSRAEEGPLSLFESWWMGTPVVASDAPVIDERIIDYETGIFFPSEQIDVLAEKVVELANNQTLQGKLINSGSEAVKALTLERYASRLEDLYLSI